MRRKMPKATQRLYWSNISAYRKCPQRFLWGRGWPTIDLGRGLGKKKKPKAKRSEHHAVMGSVIADVFDRLYSDEIWKHPKEVKAQLEEWTEKYFEKEIAKRYIIYQTGMQERWDQSPPNHALLQVCKDGILGYLRTMKYNRLLGPYARSEVDLSSKLDNWLPVGGRADLIIRRDDTGVTILDGKNSGKVGTADPDQLLWYAMCFYLVYGAMPDRLMFIYYRYPYGTPKDAIRFFDDVPDGEWTGVVEVPFTVDAIKGLAAESRKVYRDMEKERFDPTPSPKNCMFCDFEQECDARIAQKLRNSRTPKTAEMRAVKASTGFITFGIDD